MTTGPVIEVIDAEPTVSRSHERVSQPLQLDRPDTRRCRRAACEVVEPGAHISLDRGDGKAAGACCDRTRCCSPARREAGLDAAPAARFPMSPNASWPRRRAPRPLRRRRWCCGWRTSRGCVLHRPIGRTEPHSRAPRRSPETAKRARADRGRPARRGGRRVEARPRPARRDVRRHRRRERRQRRGCGPDERRTRRSQAHRRAAHGARHGCPPRQAGGSPAGCRRAANRRLRPCPGWSH